MAGNEPAEIIRRILQQRSISDEERFLNPDYERDSHDPMLLPDIKPALKRLKRAKEDREKVIVYGDYDIDGLCATALLLDAFNSFGLNSEAFIPDRFKDGYGLNGAALKRLAKQGATLVVTVDCGSTSVEEIKQASIYGLDIIVTDHHEVPPVLPSAVAIINPKRHDSRYPFKDLAGNGVAFKLVQAMQKNMPGLPDGQEKWLLDLVAFGTVCDVVSLTDENRMLVSKGLQVISRTRRPGFIALSQVTGVSLKEVNTGTLGFIFGPRLNAAGRLTHARKALSLLAAKQMNRAIKLALELDRLNSKRRQDQAAIETAALKQALQLSDHPVLVLHDEAWSHGIVGIVAARLLERLQKPVFIMQEVEDIAKGSVRSFGDFSAVEALNHARDILLTGGGHKAAAGFSLRREQITRFRQMVNEYYRSLNLENQVDHLKKKADVQITTLASMNVELWDYLQALQPFGHGNPEPHFELREIEVSDWRRVGSDKSHVKLSLTDVQGHRLDGIAFRQPQDPPAGKTNFIARLERNEYRGSVSPQAVVVEFVGD